MSDNDDLARLSEALKASPTAPDEGAKAENIALAMKNFDTLQGSRAEARPTSETFSKEAFVKGVAKMLNAITSRGAMAASTAIVAVGFAVWVVIPNAPGPLPLPDLRTEKAEAPVVEMPALTDAVEMEEADGAAGYAGIIPMAAPEPSTRLRTEVGGIVQMPTDDVIAHQPNTEAFANAAPNPLRITQEDPVSTFSIDVDTASYSVMRNSILNGSLPSPDAVRVEELVNYFPYAYPTPNGPHPFQPTVTVMDTPWNAGTQLVHIGIQGEMPEVDARPPLNLVFLIDSSGSMDSPNKLPLLKQSFRLMLSELRPEDQVSIVAYAGSSGQVLEPTSAAERPTILAALDRLSAGGSTAGQAGLQQAYQVAEGMGADGEVSRVILATDGDFNVGISNPDTLKDYIADKRDTGVYLSVLGFDRGNLQDATMQALAQNGNGTAAYIDTLSEAQKVLVDQLTGALFPIADDVKIQVEFNPETVTEYRLIGYETRALAREDFNNDAVDAGEIGAGHTVTALYEVTPVGSDAVMSDALRYAPPVDAPGSGELGFLKLRYKAPGEDVSTLIETPILSDMAAISEDARFSAAIAGFGQLLRDGKYLGDWGYRDLIALANANRGADAYGYRTEAVQLMRLAQSLAR